MILFFSARLSQGMIGPVAEIAKDCAAPGIFNYVRRLILFNAKKYEMPEFRPNTDSGQEK